MEAYAQSSEDALIDGLSFKLGNSASYITDRKSCTFQASGSNIYTGSGSGTKVIKFQLNADGWLDPSTTRVMFNLVNKGTAAQMLRPLQGAYSFFRRLRITANGALVEDVSDYNRVHHMFEVLTSVHNRDNDDIEGFGYRSDTVQPGVAHTEATGSLPGIAGQSHQTVSFKLCSGLFSQPKMIPLKYCPLTIELELVTNNLDPIVDPATAGFLPADTSTDWEISDVSVKTDIVTLDNTLQNNYDSHLLSGKSLPINYNTYIVQSQVVAGKDVSVNMSRAISRLKSVFVALYRAPGTAKPEDKEWLNFYHPMSDVASYSKAHELEFQIQIGSKLYPEYPIRSLAESFAQLKKSVGILGSNFHSVSISPKQYRNQHFIVGVDTEMSIGASMTGKSTKTGDLLTVKMKGDTTIEAVMPTQMMVVLHSDNIMSISDSGTQVYD